MTAQTQKAQFGTVTFSACIIRGCGKKSIPLLRGFEGSEFCLCPPHSEEAIRKERVFSVFDKDKSADEVARFVGRRKRSGLSDDALGVLGISIEDQNPNPKETTEAMKIAKRHNDQTKQGVLVLAGHNGIGKSIAGAFAAWSSRGRFVPRSEWCKLTTWEKDADEVYELINQHGTLVFDEVCQKSSAYESPESIKVLNMIATERHDNGRSSILTTRESKGGFLNVLGNDILDRCRQLEITHGSGFFELKGKSLR